MFKSEDVRKIAALSSLELTDEEVAKFVEQFTVIMKYFEKLKEVDVGELADLSLIHISEPTRPY